MPSHTLIIPRRVLVRLVEMEHKRCKSAVFGPGVRRSSRATRVEEEDVNIHAAVVAKADMKVGRRTSEEAAALNRNLCIKALFLRNETGTQQLTFPTRDCQEFARYLESNWGRVEPHMGLLLRGSDESMTSSNTLYLRGYATYKGVEVRRAACIIRVACLSLMMFECGHCFICFALLKQGNFDASKQCNNTIIINDSAFDMLNESSPAFGEILAHATQYVQVRYDSPLLCLPLLKYLHE